MPPETAKPPRKYQPQGVEILYEDRDILVADKAAGLLTMGTDREKTRTAYYRLTDYVRKGNAKSRNRIFIVHRLDREVSGVLVFAKNIAAKEKLQGQWDEFSKTYLAIVHGTLDKKNGVISSYLTENSAHVVYSAPGPDKGKLARTAYKVLKETPCFSLLEIDLLTGRKNQIRVHLAEMGHPIAGDEKYGREERGFRRLALHAKAISFIHPYSGEPVSFEARTPGIFQQILEDRSAPPPRKGNKEQKAVSKSGKPAQRSRPPKRPSR